VPRKLADVSPGVHFEIFDNQLSITLRGQTTRNGLGLPQGGTLPYFVTY
jgi:hypothetical protein